MFFYLASIILQFQGQLGNQLFQTAAAIALAEENRCGIYFPDFDDLSASYLKSREIDKNFHAIFRRIPHRIGPVPRFAYYAEPDFAYHPIPYQPNIEISGYFMSEKHFKKHRDLIIELFAPPEEIEADLQRDFSWLLEQPNTVGLHVRTWYKDYQAYDSNPKFYAAFLPPDIGYYKEAIDRFPADALFVVFSDRIDWCKKNFREIERKFYFVEGQDYLHDFYLLSKCKHAIVGSSSFSWWAAYLNPNPEKVVILRKPFVQSNKDDPADICCDGWISIYRPQTPPIPTFDALNP
jgi:hypothetical protein